MEITPADWRIIRRVFRDGFASGFRGLAHDLERDPRVCVMALNSSRWELLAAAPRGVIR